jgi:hypothetical protein
VEPSGANCSAGGVKLEFGRDKNGNHTLQDDEIDPSLTRYVCNGQGSNGAPGQSVTVDTVPSGDPRCPAGGAKFTASNGVAFACNAADPNMVLNAGAAPLDSCLAILNAGGSRGSGVYRIAPSGAAPFLAYCDMTTQQGGWTLAMNINPSDGNHVGFANTTFWTVDAEYGDFMNHFTNDYKSPAAFKIAATNVMVQVAQLGPTGAVIGWKAWTTGLKTFDTFFVATPNTQQTTGIIGSDVTNVYIQEPLIKNGTDLFSNRSINFDGDRIRLGAGPYGTPDNNSPGLGTQMNENICRVGNHCFRHRDVELLVSNTSEDWCTPPGFGGSFKWVGTDGGCGQNCPGACAFMDGQYVQTWAYRIYVREQSPS